MGFAALYPSYKGYKMPDGQISEFAVKPDISKYSACPVGQISATSSPRPFPARGAYRDRHERGMGCGGRDSVGAQ